MLILWFYCQVFHKNEELLRRTLFLLSVITNIYNVIENDKNFHSPWCFFLKVKSLPWFSRKKNILEQEEREGHRVEKVWKNAELPSSPVKVNHHFEEDQK